MTKLERAARALLDDVEQRNPDVAYQPKLGRDPAVWREYTCPHMQALWNECQRLRKERENAD